MFLIHIFTAECQGRSFSLSFSACCRAKIQWAKDHKLISSSKKYRISKKGALRIQEASYGDTGVFTCLGKFTIVCMSRCVYVLCTLSIKGHLPNTQTDLSVFQLLKSTYECRNGTLSFLERTLRIVWNIDKCCTRLTELPTVYNTALQWNCI